MQIMFVFALCHLMVIAYVLDARITLVPDCITVQLSCYSLPLSVFVSQV